MIKPSVNLQELRRRIYRKAKAEKQWRFLGLFVPVSKKENLRAACQGARGDDGTAGVGWGSFLSLEARGGREVFSRLLIDLI